MGDFLGFLCKKGGLNSSEIGKIDVNDRYAYAAIARPKLKSVLNNVKGEKIKGVKTIVEEVRWNFRFWIKKLQSELNL